MNFLKRISKLEQQTDELLKLLEAQRARIEALEQRKKPGPKVRHEDAKSKAPLQAS